MVRYEKYVAFHCLFLSGVYAEDDYGKTRFYRVKAPTNDELNTLVHTISQRIAHKLEQEGLLERDAENAYLQLDHIEEDPMHQLQGHSITYRIAIGPRQGQKVFTLQTLPAHKAQSYSPVGKVAGFSLHADVMAEAHQRDKLVKIVSIHYSACRV